MKLPLAKTTVVKPLSVAMRTLAELAESAEKAGCAALFTEATIARDVFFEAAEFDGVEVVPDEATP